MDEQLLTIKNMVTSWYETYRNQDKNHYTMYMFADSIMRLVEPYLAELYQTNSITPEEYSEMMAYCQELMQKLRKELGLEDAELVMDYIRGC